MSRNLCILDPVGKILLIFGLSMFLPIPLALLNGNTTTDLAVSFALPGAYCLAAGAGGWFIGKGRAHEFKIRHASLLVILTWFFLPAIGAYPLLRYTDGNFIDAYFESVSGLTASGATILNNIDELPDAIKLWRGLMTWMGGLGLIVLAVAILPNLGVGGRQLMKSEITGPLKDQDLTPQINETAKGLWFIYILLTTACGLAYLLCGMSWLDALVHSFTTMGLGGFSNHDASFAYFDSPLVEAVAVVFMLVAGFNFATHFSALISVRRNYRDKTLARHGNPFIQRLRNWTTAYRKDAELRPYLVMLAFGSLTVCVAIYLTQDIGLGTALRHGIFNTVSIATTTGYSNTDFYQWPLAIAFWLLLLGNFTSCSGSTGGGIKMIRALTIFSCMRVEQVKMLHPTAFQEVKVNGRVIKDSIVSSILFFVLAYIITILATTLLLLASQPGLDMVTALSAAMACVSNTGPGLGEVGPGTTYASLNPVATSISALAMLLGRLELLLFLLLFSRGLWN